MAKQPRTLSSREVTPESLYLRRREFIRNAALYAATSGAIGGGLLWLTQGMPLDEPRRRRPAATAPPSAGRPEPAKHASDRLVVASRSSYAGNEKLNSFEEITTYNNFYEFGEDKSDPAANAHTLRTRPWTVAIEGEVRKPRLIDIDKLLRWFPLEERVYRMRCVEAWSMVIPWVGFPLAALIRRLEPLSSAKYVAFTTLLDRDQMPGEISGVLDWPYVEGLRMDEAMHPLTLMVVGLYGRVLPNQNGAPLRLVVPWKYGFKGIKSIVKIAFTETQPRTTWSEAVPNAYGFYANVNPAVDHPAWSQATERRIGEFERRPTLPFNGYADQVAHLYAGMDLRANF